jgi:hypothetical protein
MGFGVPTEAELKAETTEAEVNKVTNLSTAFNSFLRMPAAGFLNINSSNPSTGRPNVISARSKVIMWTKTSAFEASKNLYTLHKQPCQHLKWLFVPLQYFYQAIFCLY